MFWSQPVKGVNFSEHVLHVADPFLKSGENRFFSWCVQNNNLVCLELLINDCVATFSFPLQTQFDRVLFKSKESVPCSEIVARHLDSLKLLHSSL